METLEALILVRETSQRGEKKERNKTELKGLHWTESEHIFIIHHLREETEKSESQQDNLERIRL